jgi:Transposase, Mutator family
MVKVCVISQSPDPLMRIDAHQTNRKDKSGTIDVKALLAGDEEFLRALVRTALHEVLKSEMTQALGTEKSKRTAGRLNYRWGYYGWTLITRIGRLELRVPQEGTTYGRRWWGNVTSRLPIGSGRCPDIGSASPQSPRPSARGGTALAVIAT